MRYVRDRLVLRLQRRPSEELLDAINSRFADILTRGRFSVSAALPEEKEQSDLAALPRLVCYFDRQSFGRLRRLIDFLNAEDVGGTAS